MRLFSRSISQPVEPNDNSPEEAAPGTVGPPSAVPGDPSGFAFVESSDPGWVPPTILPSAWSGWPADWGTSWANDPTVGALTDVAWMCVDYNASTLSTMPPYLVNAAPSLEADWLNNPDP